MSDPLVVDDDGPVTDADAFILLYRGIRIPAGTRGRPCNGPTCKDLIFDVGKQVVSVKPYIVDGVERTPAGVVPTETDDGAGISHFANCIDRERFRRK